MRTRWCILAAALSLASVACSGDGGDDTSGEGTATSAAASGVPDSSGAAGEMQFGDLQMLKDAIELAGLRLCDLAKLTDSGDYEQLLYQAFLDFCIPGKDGDGAVMIESWSDPVRLPAPVVTAWSATTGPSIRFPCCPAATLRSSPCFSRR